MEQDYGFLAFGRFGLLAVFGFWLFGVWPFLAFGFLSFGVCLLLGRV